MVEDGLTQTGDLRILAQDNVVETSGGGNDNGNGHRHNRASAIDYGNDTVELRGKIRNLIHDGDLLPAFNSSQKLLRRNDCTLDDVNLNMALAEKLASLVPNGNGMVNLSNLVRDCDHIPFRVEAERVSEKMKAFFYKIMEADRRMIAEMNNSPCTRAPAASELRQAQRDGSGHTHVSHNAILYTVNGSSAPKPKHTTPLR